MTDYPQRVVVQDVHMSFGSIVVFMVKAVVAAIPAAVLLGLIAGLALGAGMTFLGIAVPR